MSFDPTDVWLIQSRVSGACPLIWWGVCHMHVHLQSGQLLCKSGAFVDVWRSYCPSNKSINLYRGFATDPNLSLTTDHTSILHSLDFGGVQWSRCRSCSRLNLLLMLTLHPCRFLFYMQVMILARSYYRLSSLAITSVDWCCLYIIIHNSISHRTWLWRLVHQSGRLAPEEVAKNIPNPAGLGNPIAVT